MSGHAPWRRVLFAGLLVLVPVVAFLRALLMAFASNCPSNLAAVGASAAPLGLAAGAVFALSLALPLLVAPAALACLLDRWVKYVPVAVLGWTLGLSGAGYFMSLIEPEFLGGEPRAERCIARMP